MDLNDVIIAKIEMENNICYAVREAMERFEKETGLTPSRIDIHLASETIIRPGAIPPRRVQHAVIGVEAIITL